MPIRTAFWLAVSFLLLILVFASAGISQERSPTSDQISPLDLGNLSQRKEPIHISADQLEYQQEKDIYIAEGHVVVTQGDLRITANKLVLENTLGRLTATGQVELLEGEDLLRADRLEFNINTTQGVVSNGRIDIREDNYHIEGERMERLSEEIYLIDRGSLTTCDVCQGISPAWRFRAKKLRLRLDHYAVAKGVTFEIKAIPVAYLPYLVIPVKTTRQTGFLFPRMGYSTAEEGFKYLQPFYWAISPSQDATISFDYRSEKGIGGVLEYRYALSRVSQGRFESLYFYDRDLEQERLDLRFRHTQQFTERLGLRADLNILNRNDVRSDLSTITSERTQISVESNLFLQHRSDLHSFSLLTRFSQDLTGSDDFTLQRLPEVNLALTEWPVGGGPLLVGADFGAVNFWRKNELEDPDPDKAKLRAIRVDVFPKLWWPLDLGGLAMLTPQAGLRETYYSRGLQDRRRLHREIPFAGLELRTRWRNRYEGEGGSDGMSFHLTEPRIQYEYADRLQDGPVPRFDQVDLADDKNLVTFSLTHRIRQRHQAVPDPLRELLFLKLTQSFKLDRAEKSLSDLRVEWEIRPGEWFFLDSDIFYNHYDHRFSSINTDGIIRLSPFFEIRAGQRLTEEGIQSLKGDILNPSSLGGKFSQSEKINFLTVGANLYLPWPLTRDQSNTGLYLASKGFYNLATSSFAEIGYALKYSAQCWEVVFDYRDFPEKNQFNFMITLKGAVTMDSRNVGGLFEQERPE
jgi:LPS-assembly protein